MESFILPNLDLGEIAVFHLVRDHDEFDVPLHLCLEYSVTDEGAILTPHLFPFVRATVVEETQAAFFHMPLTGDAVATRAASGEVHELKPLVGFSVVAGLGEGDASLLHPIKRLLGNHREMRPLMEFTVEPEDAIIEGIGEHPVNCTKSEGFPFLAHESHLRHLLLNRGEGVFASGKEFENVLHLLELLGMGNDGAELWLIEIAKRSLVREFASPNLFAEASPDDGGEVSHVLIRHPELYRHHEHVVGGVV